MCKVVALLAKPGVEEGIPGDFMVIARASHRPQHTYMLFVVGIATAIVI